jgi:hypothetical protein
MFKAREKHSWDIKKHTPNGNKYYGSKLYGKYASARDAGNFAAGMVSESSIFPNDSFDYGFGSYAQSNNKLLDLVGSVYYDHYLMTSGNLELFNTGKQRMGNMMKGEYGLSQMGIDAGRNYVKGTKK